MKEVCILIPTLNEEATIGGIIQEFKHNGFEHILVIDGNSTDATREIATQEGARVEVQRGKGKGTAVRQGFEVIEEEIIVIIDGDGTYLPSEVKSLLEPILKDEADHVIGNRFGFGGAFSRSHRVGNWILNKVFGLGYGVKLNDILSGYRALTKDSLKKMNLRKEGFEIETEMVVESVKRGIRIKEVPIRYEKRRGASKLNFIRDGLRILYTLYVLARMYNPMFYFGIIGTLFIAIGIFSGFYVVLEWYRGITHVLLTVFTSLMIISGIQFLMFGQLGDLLVSLQKDMIEVFRELGRKK
ncbi:MAG: S-layer glycoprotein N-glycosyltransferase AglJ [Methanophagales archaeon ANME-1-THS]|nr:MAG: S-layer glycoprotein N-glycosyltransferase AglJ [Methanophagales archaeon ANME-1-THS]